MKKEEICTIYLLTNTKTSKVYVGQTWNKMEKRLGKYGYGYSNCPYLYASIQKHGVEFFKYDLLDECYDQKMADYLEDMYINIFDSRNTEFGYNIKGGGSAGLHSEATKEKISATLKAQAALWSPEELHERTKAISGFWAGKIRGPQSEERRNTVSEAMKEWHAKNDHPMLGKHHTDEAKLLISESSKGRKCSPESVEKRALKLRKNLEKDEGIVEAYNKGVIVDKICEDFGIHTSTFYRILFRNHVKLTGNFKRWVGKTHSEESKKKASESQKKRWTERKAKKAAKKLEENDI